MTVTVARVIGVAMLAALAAAVLLVAFVAVRPGLELDMSRDVPRAVTGVYGVERDPAGRAFAWTSRRVDIHVNGLDRRAIWLFSVRVRGARRDPAALPEVTI
ncbi:MAG: hypothetical protein HYX76_06710, partial [Acidobacteria bacterium]|nr:hypothetical protein [Acidobacteriota bacterium]